MRVYVPCDSGALSVGADAVAAATAASPDVTVVRTGSRGAYWLEPLVEIERDGRRYGFGPLAVGDVPSVLAAARGDGSHPLALGPVDEIPWLARQTRLTFERCGVVDPLSIEDYLAHGGFAGLRRAIELGPGATIGEVTASGLRGRGGAGFPAGVKWQAAAEAPGDQKYIVCNADEGDSGTFADRMLMEGDPFAVIEGMLIAGFAVGATHGYIYIRSEYPHAFRTTSAAVESARAAGYLGEGAGGTGQTFDLDVRLGAGAYICGEETSLLESLEGKRGVIRAKPPLPVHSGLFGKPTVVNNLVTLATVPWILSNGSAGYQALGTGRSRGTLTIQLAGNVKQGGLVEVPFGVALRDVIYDFGGGTASDRPLRAVQVGGPLGAYFPGSMLDTPLDYEAFSARDGLVGHGGLVVFDDTVDLGKQARFAMEFCAAESCGKCTPCRIGSTRGVEVIDRILAGEDRDMNLVLLDDLCDVMSEASLCLLGGLTPLPVRSALRYFPEDFDRAPVTAGTAT